MDMKILEKQYYNYIMSIFTPLNMLQQFLHSEW